MKYLWISLSCLALVVAAGCADDSVEDGPQGVGPDSPVTEGESTEYASPEAIGSQQVPLDYVAVEAGRDSEGVVVVTPAPSESTRELRRMSIKQLSAAIQDVTGGIVWQDNGGRDMFMLLEETLGVPNYRDTTNEDLEASLVFQKFLGDAARAVCDEAVARDVSLPVEERVIVTQVDPGLTWEEADEEQRAAIDANLRYLKLRFTGHPGTSDDGDALARERWLFRSVTHATSDPMKGWRAVCVGLMSSPEFYLY